MTIDNSSEEQLEYRDYTLKIKWSKLCSEWVCFITHPQEGMNWASYRVSKEDVIESGKDWVDGLIEARTTPHSTR